MQSLAERGRRVTFSFSPSLSGSGRVIFEVLRDDIVFGRLNPRERLVEGELVIRFASHRAAVREALVALERAGLVDRQRNKGASVLDLKPERVKELYAVRLLLETAAIGDIPLPLDPAALATLVAIQDGHQRAVAENDLQSIFKRNNLFHRHLHMQSGNSMLVDLIDQCATRALTVRSHPYMDRSFLTRVCKDHWEMIDACRAIDRPRLIALAREHLVLAKRRYLRTYSGLREQDEALASRRNPARQGNRDD